MRNRSKIIGDAPCPQCRKHGRDRTGNHLILFEDGGAYCNRCSYTESTPLTKNVSRHAEGDSTPGLQPGKGSSVPSTTNKKNHMNMPTVQDVLSYMPRALPERGLTFDTVNHFGVRVHVDETSGEPTQHSLPKDVLYALRYGTFSQNHSQPLGQPLNVISSGSLKPELEKPSS